MNELEFDNAFRRLRSTYGEKAFNDERKRLLYEKFGNLPCELFSKLIDQMILDHLQPPNFEKMRQTVNSFGSAAKAPIYDPDPNFENPKCLICYDQGFLFADRKGKTEVEYVFLCNCEVGFKRKENMPRWGAEWFHNFEWLDLKAYKAGKNL